MNLENLLPVFFRLRTCITKFRKSASSIPLSLKINTSNSKVYLNYPSEFGHKYINVEPGRSTSLSSKINTSTYKVYFKYTSKFENF